MVTLDPTQYQRPSQTMLGLGPAGDPGEHGIYGDAYLDAETVAAFLEAATTGVFGLNPDWMPSVADADDAVLEKLFLERLRMTRLGRNSPALHHRRLALFEAVKDLGQPGTVPGFGLSVHNITRAIGDVDTWLEGKRQELEAHGMDDEQLARMLTLIRPRHLAAMLATSEMNLSRWRKENSGPRYVKIGDRSVAYPAIAVLEWLQERMSS